MKLYELEQQFHYLVEAIEEAEDAEVREILQSAFEQLGHDLGKKIETLVKIMRNYEGEAEMIATERKELQKKERAASNKAARIKELIDHTLKNMGFNGENKKRLQAGVWKV